MVVSALAYVLISVCVWRIYLKLKRPGNLPPGPKGYLIVGNLFQFDVNRSWHTLVEWKKIYGDIVYIRLFNQDVIVLNSAKAAGDLLDRRAANYSNRPRMPVAECLTGGLNIGVIEHGAKWRSLRRAAHEALNIRASVNYNPIHTRESIQLALDILDSSQICHDHVYRYTSFGVASIIYNDIARRYSIIKELSTFMHDISLATTPGRYLANHIPILEHVPAFLAKWKREMKAKYRMYTESFLKFFLPIKDLVIQKQDHGPSFCAMLAEAQERHGLSDSESAWLAAVLYVAGYDTSMTALEWLIVAMLTFPDVQRRIHEEIDTVIGQTRIPTLADMENLPYMRAVVKEVLRWRPPVPIGVFHASLEDDVYEGYHIPKGSWIIANILAMNHDSETYGQDPDVFRPERFLNEDGTHKVSPADTKDEGHYSFGFGRRICPGRHVASNALLSFAIVFWAVHLEPGKDAQGNTVSISINDQADGILSRPPTYHVSAKPRFPEAMEILKIAKEECL
ncbi:o-methylsterigmatocystin oxidoreductase [Moniliophthora roreri MCA 2997]|uniref:O-methylsterigmatocystin oxidoreductase n=1 Tax=Moniliophthora roreri (strain MCA 2997) TaxID=1381753 RepID=V2XVF5_MONRO|nr:o-methylsterigmatocystin oxidoreductase [Moniliophthora roreri MCA 2997]